jgi:peptide/nickel transport system substrate-binding protein
MVTLFDREGTLVPALADQQVREAINHAIDREGITLAMAGDYGTASGQLVIPGGFGSDESINDLYPYDPDLAIEMLEDAGYGDGFDLSITCATLVGSCPTAEAVAADLGKVGIRVTIDEVTGEVQGFDDKLRSATVPAAMQTAGRDPERTVALFGLPSDAPVSNNPFQSSDDEITDLYNQAVRMSDREEQGALWAQANKRMMELAWFVPIFVRSDLYYTQPNVGGFEVTNGNPVYTPVDPFDGSSSWYLTD